MPENPRSPTLDAILAVTRKRVEALKPRAGELERAAQEGPAIRPFPGAAAPTVGVIAEVKRRSPSQGAIREDLDPVAHARAYVRGGAVAVSVLTNEAHFGGSIDDLRSVAAAVTAPILRKDFVINEVQIHEARAAGASAVLLIARIMNARQLDGLARMVRWLDMVPLIEVHAAAELDAALAAGPSVLGINARDLDTLVVDLGGAEALIGRVPAGIQGRAERRGETRGDGGRLADAGGDLLLCGADGARP